MFPDVCRCFRKQRFRPRGKKPCLKVNSFLMFHFPCRPPSGISSKCPLPINKRTGLACTSLSRIALALRLIAVIPRRNPRNRTRSPAFSGPGECGFSTSVSSVADPEGKFCGVVTTFSSTALSHSVCPSLVVSPVLWPLAIVTPFLLSYEPKITASTMSFLLLFFECLDFLAVAVSFSSLGRGSKSTGEACRVYRYLLSVDSVF